MQYAEPLATATPVDTVPTDEELEQRRRQENVVALIRREKWSGNPPTAVLMDAGYAESFVATLELWSSNERMLARIIDTPERLAKYYEDVEEFDAFVVLDDADEESYIARPFYDQARRLVAEKDA